LVLKESERKGMLRLELEYGPGYPKVASVLDMAIEFHFHKIRRIS
jgi:hypothetical protein